MVNNVSDIKTDFYKNFSTAEKSGSTHRGKAEQNIPNINEVSRRRGRYDGFAENRETNDKTTEEKMKEAFGEAAKGYDLIGKKESLSYVIKSGKKSTITIDPRFYASIADDPEKIKEYSEAIETMKKLDKQFERQAKARGMTVISRGWYIDKNGGISSWSITKTERNKNKSYLERTRDYIKKLQDKKTKKKKEELKLQEKRSERKEEELRLEGRKKAAMNEKFKRKSRKCVVIDINDLEIIRRQRQKNEMLHPLKFSSRI